MKKEKLKKYLESIKKITEQESKLDDALREISPDFGGYSNELAIDTLLNMMKDLAKDESEWIDYFIFELDWGKSYKDGMVTDENGKNIPLATIDDVLNIIEKENKEDVENTGVSE